MSRKPSKPETRIEDYLDVMTGGNAALPQPILRIEFYYAFLAGMTVKLPQPILDDEKLLAKICGMEVEAPTYIPGISPRLYAYMAKKGGQDVEIPQPVTREEMYWFDYCGGTPTPPEREYTGAVPVTITADGTPLLDYLISGNTVQSGTPTPDNPIMPEGTGERTGNLFDINATPTKYSQSTTVTVDGRTLTISGSWYIYYEIDVVPNTDYYIKWSLDYTEIEGRGTIAILTTSGQTITQQSAQPFSFNSGENQRIRVYIYSGSSAPTTVIISNIMLNTGSTALPYEPYGYKIPISSASTTTPVYLGEVQTTRRIGKIDLSELSWIMITNGLWVTVNIPNIKYTSVNTELGDGISEKYTIHTGSGMSTALNCIAIDVSQVSVNTGSPSEKPTGMFWYVLAEPETGIVNEPLMKIGEYADTLSMEQAGAQIPTANGSTTLDVETTVKPSEVYIKYRGEAVATVSELSAEVSSPEETPEEVNPEETEEEENER